jgi:hypothetical protein
MAKVEDGNAVELPLEVVGDQLLPAITEDDEREQFGKSNGPIERELMQHNHMRRDPWAWAREVSFFVSGQGWRGYQNVIGQPAFYSGYSDNMKSAVARSPLLQHKIQDLAESRVKVEKEQGLLTTNDTERKEQILAALREVVGLMTDQMICKMESRPFIRGAYYMCTQLLTRAYHQGRAIVVFYSQSH